MKIGIVGAMMEEIGEIVSNMIQIKTTKSGGRNYYEGELNGVPIVVAFSRWGLVAAAATVTDLILTHKVDAIVFTGASGSISPALKIGDIVVVEKLYQHDMDARPIIQRYSIPLTNKRFFEVNKELLLLIHQATVTATQRILIQGKPPRIFKGNIASGNQFVTDKETRERIQNDLPSILSVDMEGSAAAQICNDYDIPFAIVKSVSDTADSRTESDFNAFIQTQVGNYSYQIIKEFLRLYKEQNYSKFLHWEEEKKKYPSQKRLNRVLPKKK
jgi:adenosylhomocysteine nucleosidase